MNNGKASRDRNAKLQPQDPKIHAEARAECENRLKETVKSLVVLSLVERIVTV